MGMGISVGAGDIGGIEAVGTGRVDELDTGGVASGDGRGGRGGERSVERFLERARLGVKERSGLCVACVAGDFSGRCQREEARGRLGQRTVEHENLELPLRGRRRLGSVVGYCHSARWWWSDVVRGMSR